MIIDTVIKIVEYTLEMYVYNHKYNCIFTLPNTETEKETSWKMACMEVSWLYQTDSGRDRDR